MADAPFVFLPLGAIIQSINVGGINIVQGFPSAAEYQSHNSPYFGETIGRVANRIAGAKINSINGGKSYPLAANNGTNNLHGGNVGWGKKIWNGPKPVGIRPIPGLDGLEGGESVEFTLRSEDGEEGFPGTLDVKVIYTTATQKVNGKTAYVLGIEYEAELVDGADETVINMTNHSYFNLSGEPTIEGTTVELVTDQHLPLDEAGIPLRGPEAPFPGTKVNAPFTLTATEPNIDDCFVVNVKSETVPIDTRSEPLTRLAAASHPKTNIHLEVYSTEPAFQFYTGKHIDVPAVAGVPARINRSGFCVEPGRYVNAINVPEWKNQALLKKGEKYGCRTVYRVWQE